MQANSFTAYIELQIRKKTVNYSPVSYVKNIVNSSLCGLYPYYNGQPTNSYDGSKLIQFVSFLECIKDHNARVHIRIFPDFQ